MTDTAVPTNDIETVGAGAPQTIQNAGELVSLTKDELVAWLHGDDLAEGDEDDEITYEQALRVLSAESPEAALKKDDIRAKATLSGTTFVVRSVSWRKSYKHDALGRRYGFCSCVDGDGVPFYTSMGGTKVVLRLRKFQLAGWLPATFTLVTETTNTGNEMDDLEAPDGGF